jgi:hypothetical protein
MIPPIQQPDTQDRTAIRSFEPTERIMNRHRKNMMASAKTTLLLLVVCCFVSCAPRGETRSLAELLASAKDRYSTSRSGSGLPQTAQNSLDGLTKALSDFLLSGNVRDTGSNAAKVVVQMSALAKSAGYTSRPAFYELLKQYEAIANDSRRLSNAGKDSPQVKLLVARTYNLLARELETTRFQL